MDWLGKAGRILAVLSLVSGPGLCQKTSWASQRRSWQVELSLVLPFKLLPESYLDSVKVCGLEARNEMYPFIPKFHLAVVFVTAARVKLEQLARGNLCCSKWQRAFASFTLSSCCLRVERRIQNEINVQPTQSQGATDSVRWFYCCENERVFLINLGPLARCCTSWLQCSAHLNVYFPKKMFELFS